jgi:cytochrome b subunit of formate dehydrogenase
MRRYLGMGVLVAVLGATLAPAVAQDEAELAVSADGYLRGPGTERDAECLICHVGLGEEEAPKLNLELYEASRHADEGCIGCHPDAEDPDIDHVEEDQDLAPTDCASCHEDSGEDILQSIHRSEEAAARAEESGDELPSCASCHGVHDIFSAENPKSRTHPIRQVESCGECHEDGVKAAGHRLKIPAKYAQIVERGDPKVIERLMEEGELVAAACSDCHGAHEVWPSDDERSTLHPARITATCAECHSDETEGLRQERPRRGRPQETASSGRRRRLDGEDLTPRTQTRTSKARTAAQPPTCVPATTMHSAPPPSDPRFHLDLVEECGTCHGSLMETYQESYHGKVTALGDASVAQCSDCHGYHDIRSPSDAESMVSSANRLDTCRDCHPNAPKMFASYMPHADARNAQANPVLFWIYAAMTALLVSVFMFFGIHTVLWGIRDAVDAIREGRPLPRASFRGTSIERFTVSDRILHLLVIISFLGLAATGTPLRFAHTEWAQVALQAVGGVSVAGLLHRIFGVVTIGYFVAHLAQLVIRLWPRIVDGSFVRAMIGPDSLVPNASDVGDVFANFRYFLGLGPKPTFDRWTYWEKFDYWAVFWGVVFIGATGLILWFPTLSTNFVPGWFINVATIVHSQEALLAMGFIFAVHFFNSHLRRRNFPMDEVIFTGSVPLEAYREERGREWARVEREGRVHEMQGSAPSTAFRVLAYVFGMAAWLFGLALLGFIIHGFLTAG